MGALAGILNQHIAAGQTLTGASASPLATSAAGTSGTSSSSSSSSSSATISANDFLTLLVTEMQNQDPTANTDPNEYINQLVQVNSLEQLIDINQNLSTALGSSSTSAAGAATGQTAGTTSSLTGAGPAGNGASALLGAQNQGAAHAVQPSASGASASSPASSAFGIKHATGNLSIPNANPAAHRVAHALDGKTRRPSLPGGLPGV